MRVVIMCGTGHAGTYLVPRIVEAGHEVVCVSRQLRRPYQSHAAWESVRQISMDRSAAEQDGSFGDQVRLLGPDAVIDMVCYTPESANQLAEPLRGRVQHFSNFSQIEQQCRLGADGDRHGTPSRR